MNETFSRYLRLSIFLILIGAIISLATCRQDIAQQIGNWFMDIFTKPTPRLAWLKEAEKDDRYSEATLYDWKNAYEFADTQQLTIELPHLEKIRIRASEKQTAQSFLFSLPPGRSFHLRILPNGESPVFSELVAVENPDAVVAYGDTLTHEFYYENERKAVIDFRLIVQSLPLQSARYEIELTTTPILTFPVAGKSDDSIQSFWGASRDGGKRSHEGNDIFAPKRTPVVAVTAGQVSRVKEGGIGGKTVWLRDGEGRSLSYYYAHLDEQWAQVGDLVERGDTLGLVGNTGNARTTPPHLHFGIYASGAIDPFPFIQDEDEVPSASPLRLDAKGKPSQVPIKGNHYLRKSPSRKGAVIRQLLNGERVTITGSTARFYRLHTSEGEAGYANFD